MIRNYTFAFVCLLLNFHASLNVNRSGQNQRLFASRLLMQEQFVSWDKSIQSEQNPHSTLSSPGIWMHILTGNSLSLLGFKMLKRFFKRTLRPGRKRYWQTSDESRLQNLRRIITLPWAAQKATMTRFRNGYGLVLAIRRSWSRYGWTYFWMGTFVLLLLGAGGWLYVEFQKRKYRNWQAQQQIGNLKSALQALNNTKHRLEKKLWIQTHLLASISHDIRTPVGFISLSAKEIKSLVETGQKGAVTEFARMIALSSDEIVRHVQHMTAIIKSTAYEGQIRFSDVSLGDLLLQKKKLFEQTIGFQNATLSVQIEDDLRVETNPELLGVLLHNLIDNALKVQEGNTIKIFSQTTSGKLHLFIEDSGPGMSTSLIDWLSNDSRAIERLTSSEAPTLGLGLIMIKEISWVLGIKVRAENTAGARICLIFDR